MGEPIRLQKFLADKGIDSRRKCEEHISNGLIKVNGKIITVLGTKIDPEKDEVLFKEKRINTKNEKKVYILLNKPIGYVTTVKDQFERDTVLDLVKLEGVRLVPAGRLDMYTSGALILTNDGEFIYKITHPKHEILKTYNVTVKGDITIEEIEKLKNGVEIDNVITSKAIVKILKKDEEKNNTRLEIKIHEGRNRQIRKMCEAIGKSVLSLHRTQIGNLNVKDLKLGTWRFLKENEIRMLLE